MKAIKLSEKIGNVLKFLLSIFVCCYLISILFSWNHVMHFKNYIYLSHPMSAEINKNNHYTSADLNITVSNAEMGVCKEQYKFTVDNSLKSIESSQRTASLDTLASYISPIIGNKIKVSSGLKTLRYQASRYNVVPKNAFGVIRFSTPSARYIKNSETDIYKVGTTDFTIHKSGLLEDSQISFWLEESTFQEVLNGLRKWEKSEFRTSVFSFNDNDTDVNTFYGFGADTNRPVIIQDKKSSYGSFRRLINLLVAPYDISKAQYDCAIMSYGIDSISLNITFDEGVETSEISSPSLLEIDAHHIKFANIGNNLPKELTAIFNQASVDETRTFDVAGNLIREYKEKGTISLSVKFLESKNWQWIRLFILTTFITYLFSKIIKYAIRLLKK